MHHTNKNLVIQQIIKATRIILPCTLVFLAMDIWPFFAEPLSRGQTIGRDAYNFWAAGMLAFEGRTSEIYNNEAFSLAIKQLLGPEAGLHVFPYPPPALLGVAAFGWLSYEATLILWSTIGFLAFFFAINLPDFKRNIVWLTMLMPLVWCNIVLGQNGLLTAALFIGGLRLAHKRPILAGILIGCLAYKPTLAILIPFALLFERRWIVIISAATTLLILCLLPTLIWGTQVWIDYLKLAVPFQGLLLEHGTGLAQTMKLTPFMSMRLLNYEINTAYLIQALFLLVTITIVSIYFLKRKITNLFNGIDILILSIATILIIPYTHFYDLSLITGSILLLIKQNIASSTSLLAKSHTLTIIYMIPIIGLLLNIFIIPITPIVLLISLFILCFGKNQIFPQSHKADVV